MAAVMMMASPITAKAEIVGGVVDQVECEYRIPSISETDGGYVPADFSLWLEKNPCSYFLEVGCDCPAGYEIRTYGAFIQPNVCFEWEVLGDNAKNWEVIFNEEGYTYEVWNFSVNHNNTEYSECKFLVFDEGGAGDYFCFEVMVPQGYNENLWLTIYGDKVENGKPVRDDASHLILVFSGNGTAAEQPVSTSETTEQPVATLESVEQPVPATNNQGTVYVTKSGDSLAKIAQEIYGDKSLWKDIYEQNKTLIKNPGIIYANMQLILP